MTSTRIVLDFVLRQGAFTLEIHERVDARVVALVGPSGAGKTTALEAVAGLRTPARGEIRIGDSVLYDSTRRIDLPPCERHVGYVPQDIALFPHLDVRHNILYGARRGEPVDLGLVLDILEIRDVIGRGRVESLSGGERQRVAVARALMSSPRLLLLDEPLAGVDVERRRRILPCLERVRDELGVPMLYVTHDAREAEAIADVTLALDAGRVKGENPQLGIGEWGLRSY
jgi:molybdate transport system ATP-binding protein